MDHQTWRDVSPSTMPAAVPTPRTTVPGPSTWQSSSPMSDPLSPSSAAPRRPFRITAHRADIPENGSDQPFATPRTHFVTNPDGLSQGIQR